MKQLNSQNKLVNPYGAVSKGVLGKEKMTKTDVETAFMQKKTYKQGSSDDEDELDCSDEKGLVLVGPCPLVVDLAWLWDDLVFLLLVLL